MDFYKTPHSQLQSEVDDQAGLLADSVPRLFAAVVDLCLVFIIDLGILYFIGRFYNESLVNFLMGRTPDISKTLLFSIMLIFLLGGVLTYLVLNCYLLHRRGQTLGKAMMRIRIVDMHGEALPCWHIVLKRFLPYWAVLFIPVIGEFLFVLDVIPALLPKRRCIHDLIAGTKVIEVSPK